MKAKRIGVDLGGTNVRAGLVGNGKLIKLNKSKIHSQGTEQEVLADLYKVIDSVFEKSVQSIGIGCPSLVNARSGVIFDTINIPALKKVPLRKYVEKRYRVPVRIDNDANCFALGERHFGLGKKCDNFVGLVLGTGLGAGIISRGRLQSGVDCAAGEFGMIPYLDSIAERYASGQFFAHLHWQGAELAAEADQGNLDALQIFAEYGRHLAFVIKVIMYSLAPEMVVLGGSVSHSYPYFSKALHEKLEEFAYPSVLAKLKIKTSKLKNSAILGAALL